MQLSHTADSNKLQDKIDALCVALTTKEQVLISTNLTLETCQADLIRRKTQSEALEVS